MTNRSTTYVKDDVLVIEPGRSEKNYWADLQYHYLELIGESSKSLTDNANLIDKIYFA
jgi:hypothetical protein